MNSVKVLLVFPQVIVNKPITCEMIRRFDIDVNILHADIRTSKQGRMILELQGSEEDINSSIQYLKDNEVSTKLLTSNIIKNDDKCVDCGACTGICPGKALYIKSEDCSVAYDNEKCLVCGLCIKACPLKALSVGEDLYDI